MNTSDFEVIYQLYFNKVYRYVLNLSKNSDLAQEITAETFFKALNSLNKFSGKSDISTWLCAIAKNSYLSYIKKQGKACELSEIENSADTDLNIEEQVINKDSSMQILNALHKLNEPYKEVFSLRVLGELSFKQIANIFSKNENWACVTYHRAKQKIKDILEDTK